MSHVSKVAVRLAAVHIVFSTNMNLIISQANPEAAMLFQGVRFRDFRKAKHAAIEHTFLSFGSGRNGDLNMMQFLSLIHI